MKNYLSKDVKGWLKRKINISLAVLVVFAMTGSVGYSDELEKVISKGKGEGSIIIGKLTKIVADNQDEKANEATGKFSVAMGYETTASGLSATAVGYGTTASNDNAMAMGYETTASGIAATAMGYATIASGNSATTMGQETTASGVYSVASGLQTSAIGGAATAMGADTLAAGMTSVAMGTGTKALGDATTTMGWNTLALGKGATAMGIGSEALGDGSLATGGAEINYETIKGGKAFSVGSISLGNQTVAGKLKVLPEEEREKIKLGILTEEATELGLSSLTTGKNYKDSLKEFGMKLINEKKLNYDESYYKQTVVESKVKIALKKLSVGTEEAVAIGYRAKAEGDKSISLGYDIKSDKENNFILGSNIDATGKSNVIVLGKDSTAVENALSIGAKGKERQIKFVKDGTEETDAVNLRQLNKVEDKLSNGLASVTAMTSLDVTPTKIGKTKIATAVGGYNSHQAVAIGIGKNMSEGLNVNLKLGANLGRANNVTYSTGISYEF